jgi:hypothetical protein
VCRDLNVEAQKLTAEKAAVSQASDDEFSTVPLSPLKTKLQNSEIALSHQKICWAAREKWRLSL